VLGDLNEKVALLNSPRGDVDEHLLECLIARGEQASVQLEEGKHGEDCRSFVRIDERVILGEEVAVGSGLLRNRWIGVFSERACWAERQQTRAPASDLRPSTPPNSKACSW